MKKYKLTKDTYLYILSVIICFGIFMCFYKGTINADNYNYAVEEIHTYDNSLFQGNYNTINSSTSPRFFANQLTSFLMHFFNISWYSCWMIITLATYFLYSLAVTNIVFCCFRNNRLIYGICMSLMLMNSTVGLLAGFSTNGTEDVFFGAAIATSILGISFILGDRPRWNIAWMVMAAAALLHIHEGIWGGFIIVIWWLGTAIINKRFDIKPLRFLPVHIVVILLCVLPSMLVNDAVNNADFIRIFAYIRTPHHIVPSAWGITTIIQCFLLLLFPSVLAFQKGLYDKDKNKTKTILVRSGSYLAVWLLLLLSNYVFVEAIPNATIATLYISKCFKYITILAMICYLWLNDSNYKNGSPGISVFIILLAFCGNRFFVYGVVIFTLLVILNLITKSKPMIYFKNSNLQATLLSAVVTVISSIIWGINYKRIGIIILLAIALEVLILYFPTGRIKFVYKLKPLFYFALLIVVLFISTYGKLFTFQEGTIRFITAEDCLISSAGVDIYNLANEFNANTDKKTEFMANPVDDKSGWFQLISQRNCYQVWKITPSSKKLVLKWYERYTKVNNFSTRTSRDIEAVMREAGDKYVLIASDYYSDYDSNPDFIVFLSRNSYRIYRLAH